MCIRDREDAEGAASISLRSLTLVCVKSKARLRLSDVLAEEDEGVLAPGQSLLVYTGSHGASRARGLTAGQSSASWADVDESQLWQDGEVVQVKEGNKVINTVHIRV